MIKNMFLAKTNFDSAMIRQKNDQNERIPTQIGHFYAEKTHVKPQHRNVWMKTYQRRYDNSN